MKRRAPSRRRHGSVKRVAGLLLLISIAALLLPDAVSRRTGSLLQVLVPAQDLMSRAASFVAQPFTAAESGARSAEIESLRSTIETLAAQNRALRAENAVLTAVRDRGLGERGRLIPARIVADDPLAWRAAKLILAGARDGVIEHGAVLSNTFAVDAAEGERVRSGMGILAAESLIGVVDQVGTYTSKVRLLSDAATRMPVSVGRLVGSEFHFAGGSFWLVGLGDGRLQVRDVHHRYVDSGGVAVGDTVLTPAEDATLPPCASIGTVTAMEPDPDNGLLYRLEVQQRVDPQRVTRVFVVDTGW